MHSECIRCYDFPTTQVIHQVNVLYFCFFPKNVTACVADGNPLEIIWLYDPIDRVSLEISRF